MKTIIILSLGLMFTAAHAAADEDAPFAWTRDTLAMIASGDAERGQAIAEKAKCQKCHGELGISEDDATPSIAGQIPGYAFKQLVDFKTGVRESSDMQRPLRRMSRQDMADLAAYYGTLEPEAPAGGVEPHALVKVGDESRLMLPCAVCHGENGEGWGIQVPAIAGQKLDHFIETMAAYKSGARANDEYARMRFIASQLTDDEISEIARYYAARPTED